MKPVTAVILVLIATVLQTSLTPFIVIKGALPDFLLLLGLGVALRLGPAMGARIAFVSGLLEDVLLGRFIGMNAFIKGFVALMGGMVGEKVFRESLPVLLLVGFCASFASQVLVFMGLGILGYGMLPSMGWLESVAGRALYNALLFPFVFGGLKRLRPVPKEPRGNGIPGR